MRQAFFASASLFSKVWFPLLIFLYAFLMVSIISWGLPNIYHPFTYHMDEWHQLQAVKAVVKHGTPNVEGAAHGTMFQFFLSGIYLLPFVLTKIINPFVITSSLSAMEMQQKIFEVLRFNTLLFGIGTIVVVAKIAKTCKINPFFPALFFVVNPLWLTLSNYFKYDIALLFWISLTTLYFIYYLQKAESKTYFLSGLFLGIAIATKISVLPLIVPFVLIFFLRKEKSLFVLAKGIIILIVAVGLLGVPYLFYGKVGLADFFFSNLVTVPKESSNFKLGMSYWTYLFFVQFPLLFGHVGFLLGVAGSIFWSIILFLQKKRRLELLILFTCFFVLLLSLIPLKLYATGNRALVLLPYLSFFGGSMIVYFLSKIGGIIRLVFLIVLLLGIMIQAVESFGWVMVKYAKDPREQVSQWLERSMQKESVIGVENIPIYQMVPDLVLKEYTMQTQSKGKTRFSYKVIDARTKNLPPVVVITNADIALEYMNRSEKKDLVLRLKHEGYESVYSVKPDIRVIGLFENNFDFFIANLIPVSQISVYSRL